MGFVPSARGHKGGFGFFRPPGDLTIGAVMRLLEPRSRERASATILQAEMTSASDRLLDTALGQDIQAVLDTYDGMTLAALVTQAKWFSTA